MKKIQICLVIFITFSLFNCKDDFTDSLKPNITENAVTENDNRVFEGDIVLGNKLNNPYSLKNIQKSIEIQKQKGKSFDDLDLVSNYKYVRILPKNENEYNLVNADSTMDVFTYPLDYEIRKMGNRYIDKTLGDSKYTWLYTTIPSDKKLDSKLNIEVLEELFLPFGNGKKDKYDLTLKKYDKSKLAKLVALEEEAQILTGFKKAGKKSKIQDWTPSGRIMVWDERMNMNSNNVYVPGAGFVPVHGCKVLARKNIFSVKTGFTNLQGFYAVDGSYNNTTSVDYSIKWDRGEFDIYDSSNSQAYIYGPSNSISNWSPSFTKVSGIPNGTFSPVAYIYAHVHRGAHVYYYENIHGLAIRPPSNSLLASRMHLKAYLESCNNVLIPNIECRAHYYSFNSVFSKADIVLPFDLTRNDGSNIFATTAHELAHAVHWTVPYGMNNSLYVSNIGQAQRLTESWAQFVGWHLLSSYYQGVFDDVQQTNAFPWNHEGYQRKILTAIQASSYTPVFIDLVDNLNQNTTNSTFPVDNISGFNAQQIETAIFFQPQNWYSCRNFISTNFNTGQAAAVQQIFSDYD